MRPRQFGAAACAVVLAASFPQAGQLRSVASGVYSAAQAARGETIYRAQCADCHGRALEGTIGPPLAGDSFLSAWSARPLTDIVDRIQKTMPFEKPGSLSRQQSADLLSFMLQAGKFQPGAAELDEGVLAKIAFPTVSAIVQCRRRRRRPKGTSRS